MAERQTTQKPVTQWEDDDEFGAKGSASAKGGASGNNLSVLDVLDMPIDLGNVDESMSAELVPNGLYRAKIAACDVDVSQANNPMLSLRFTVEHMGKARSLYSSWMLTPDGLPITKRNILAVNPEADVDSMSTPRKMTGMVVDRYCTVRVKITVGKDDGIPRSQVRQVLPVSSAEASKAFLED